MIFPSEYSRRHHAWLLGLDGPVIPDPIPFDRIVADNPETQYVTFVNPQLPEGVAVFARIAVELNRKRPDIALLIGAVPELDLVFDLENRKTGPDPAKPLRGTKPGLMAETLPHGIDRHRRRAAGGWRRGMSHWRILCSTVD